MSDADFNPSEVLEALAPTVMSGRTEYVVGRVCFSLKFFIPSDGEFSTPPRMVAAEARVQKDFPRDVYDNWILENPDQKGRFAKPPLPDLEATLAAYMAQNDTHYLGAFAGKFWAGRYDGNAPPIQSVSWYYNRVMERESHAELDKSAVFEVNIPLTAIDRLNRPQLTQRLFADLCDILQPLSAVGGLCLTTPLAAILRQKQHEKEVLLPIADNHPGLMFGRAIDMVQLTRWRMSAVNWLTAVRGDLLARCGGREAVLGQLTREGFETAPYGEAGLLVQAGPSPQMGNLEAGVVLPHYGDLARALKPARLHVEPGGAPHIHHYGPERILFNDEVLAETQNAWLARFDEMT